MEVLTNKQEQNMNFEQLVQGIQQLDSTLRDSTVKTINRMTTMRNWLIGAYIVEYEQNGVDRASYGSKLLKSLEEKINRRGLTVTTFQAARLVYRMYPQIGSAISAKYSSLTNILPAPTIYSSLTNKYSIDGERLLSHLSFTHLRELISVEDPLVRYFYEVECIKNTWSVRELRRQIVTNLHIRIGLTEVLTNRAVYEPENEGVDEKGEVDAKGRTLRRLRSNSYVLLI